MVEQLLSQPGQLTKLLAAIALKKLAKQALISAVDSLVCRGVEQSEIKAPLDTELSQSETTLDSAETELSDADATFNADAVSSVTDAGFAAWAESATNVAGVAAGIAATVGGIASIFGALNKFFSGDHSASPYEQKKQQADQKAAMAKQRIQAILKVSPFTIQVSNGLLSVSWTPLPTTIPNVQYALTAHTDSVIKGDS